MNHKELISILSKDLGTSVKDTSEVVNRIVSAMIDELQKGNTVNIQDFGTFEVKKKMERISVIPSTQQRVLVPPKLTLTFKPAISLKEKVK
ncbi:MAG: HU family DNA-binding protein [Bacteroidaceae bacterium]|nr:HU family DNA-binding protein [Bacteroidaceae bacterium]